MLRREGGGAARFAGWVFSGATAGSSGRVAGAAAEGFVDAVGHDAGDASLLVFGIEQQEQGGGAVAMAAGPDATFFDARGFVAVAQTDQHRAFTLRGRVAP